MLNFLINNVDFLLTLVCAVAACIFFARKGQISKIKEIVLALCVNAEITYGGGTGKIKKSSVITAIYNMLPSWAKLLISGTTISKLVEDGKTAMDELADSNEAVMNMLYGTVTEGATEPTAETSDNAEEK